jgi:hypothetical protein
MEKLLLVNPRPDAVFCYNDPAGIGAMNAILGAGLKIPEDVAIIGCGNIRYAESLRVPLSFHGPSTQDPRRVCRKHCLTGDWKQENCKNQEDACIAQVSRSRVKPDFEGVSCDRTKTATASDEGRRPFWLSLAALSGCLR